MKKFFRALSLVLCIAILAGAFSSCSKAVESTPVDIEDFRVTAYVTSDTCKDLSTFDTSHIETVTDFIFFGAADFDEEGNVVLSDDFEISLNNLKQAVSAYPDKNIYLNILGPKAQNQDEDWNAQMDDLGQRHTNAFESGKLEGNIKTVLDKYGFDGVFFDYEFTISKKYWKAYDKFIISLDNVLGSEYEIGMALADWDIKQSDEAKQATDRIEIMSYDLWDDDGNHATMEIAQKSIEKFVKAGYDKAKLDLGVPFYARPTTEEGYWYSYKDYYNDIDANGLYKDDETGLTFSFNTYSLIEEKTKYAIENGLGGMMIWHYACDCPEDSGKSLFGAVSSAIETEKAQLSDGAQNTADKA